MWFNKRIIRNNRVLDLYIYTLIRTNNGLKIKIICKNFLQTKFGKILFCKFLKAILNHEWGSEIQEQEQDSNSKTTIACILPIVRIPNRFE